MVKKFLFSNDFNNPDPEDVLPLSTVETLKAEAFKEGRAKGLAEAAESNETRTVELLPLLQEEMDKTALIERNKLQNVTKQAAQICSQVLKRVFPVMTQRGAADEVSRFIEAGLQQCPESITRLLTINPHLQEDIQKFTARLVSPVEIEVQTDPSFGLTDCRIQWGDGGIERLSQSINAQVIEGLARLCEENLHLSLEDPEKESQEVTKASQEDIIDKNTQDPGPQSNA